MHHNTEISDTLNSLSSLLDTPRHQPPPPQPLPYDVYHQQSAIQPPPPPPPPEDEFAGPYTIQGQWDPSWLTPPAGNPRQWQRLAMGIPHPLLAAWETDSTAINEDQAYVLRDGHGTQFKVHRVPNVSWRAVACHVFCKNRVQRRDTAHGAVFSPDSGSEAVLWVPWLSQPRQGTPQPSADRAHFGHHNPARNEPRHRRRDGRRPQEGPIRL